LINESKIKLHYKNKWYDLIIKNIQEDSANYSYTYTATDMHIAELSKNGYGVTLDIELENNIGTAKELGTLILDGTDWNLEAEEIPQKTEETLIKVTTTGAIFAKRLLDD
jgi:hypothetical protein